MTNEFQITVKCYFEIEDETFFPLQSSNVALSFLWSVLNLT